MKRERITEQKKWEENERIVMERITVDAVDVQKGLNESKI